jgi:hypothetical protein
MGPEFHQTGYGRKFFEAQLPQLIRAIEELTKEVKRQNDMNEKSDIGVVGKNYKEVKNDERD